MRLKTVKGIASHMGLSEIRIRQILGKSGAPYPVVQAYNVGGGRVAGKYDLDEFLDFYNKTKKKPGRKSDVDFWRTR